VSDNVTNAPVKVITSQFFYNWLQSNTVTSLHKMPERTGYLACLTGHVQRNSISHSIQNKS